MGDILGLSILLFFLFGSILVIGVLFFVVRRASRSRKATEQQRIQVLEEENRRLKENQRPQ